MIIIRPMAPRDLTIFAECSFESLVGITSFPRDREKLFDKIIRSANNFLKLVDHPEDEEYYFVLEDLTTKRIGGTCGILAQSSQTHNYCYHIEEIATSAKHFSAPHTMNILRAAPYPAGSSEVCSLYLQPSFRHSGQGRLLSLSRFLFIAAHPQRFHKKMVAVIRGFIDQRQISPFWDAVGKHFCHLSFVELMVQLDEDRAFATEILPHFPLYIDLLPQEAREVIGKTHEMSRAAHQMLLQENFSFNQKIDIFDAGPLLEAKTSEIRTLKNSALVTVNLANETLMEENDYILSNENIDFRACFGKIKLTANGCALINQEIAEALLLKEGDLMRYVTIH